MSEPLMHHLGDGVYAIDRGDGILLHANDHLHPTHRIFLEPAVLAALNRFSDRCSAQANRPEPPGIYITALTADDVDRVPLDPPLLAPDHLAV